MLYLKDQGIFIRKDGKPSRPTNVEWPVAPEETSSFKRPLSCSGSNSGRSVHQALYCFYPSPRHGTCAVYRKLIRQRQRSSILQPYSSYPNSLLPVFPSCSNFSISICHFIWFFSLVVYSAFSHAKCSSTAFDSFKQHKVAVVYGDHACRPNTCCE